LGNPTSCTFTRTQRGPPFPITLLLFIFFSSKVGKDVFFSAGLVIKLLLHFARQGLEVNFKFVYCKSLYLAHGPGNDLCESSCSATRHEVGFPNGLLKRRMSSSPYCSRHFTVVRERRIVTALCYIVYMSRLLIRSLEFALHGRRNWESICILNFIEELSHLTVETTTKVLVITDNLNEQTMQCHTA